MTISAHHCCQAAELALKLGQPEDAEALCQHVLAQHRWHLRAHLLLGQASLEQENWAEATRRFRLVVAVDPECAEAHSGMGILASREGDFDKAVRHLAQAFENAPESDETREALQQALTQRAGRPVPTPAFSAACLGRFYLKRGLPQPAAEAFAAALRDSPDRDDLLLAYAAALWQAGVRKQAVELCRPYLEKTPRPLTPLLLIASDLIRSGETQRGRRLWGEARAWDPDDIRARVLFDDSAGVPRPPEPAQVAIPSDEHLADLLTTAVQLAQQLPPPGGQAALELADYAQSLGSAPQKQLEPKDPDLRRFQETVEQVRGRLFEGGASSPTAAPLPSVARSGRRPAEVLLACQEGLRNRFGQQGAAEVDRALQALASAAEKRGVAGRVVYLDRPPYPELARPDPSNPQHIKSFLDEIDRRLDEEGLDFHYLLLVGGDDLLPFARLDNPTEDSDESVPSDNLYASRDPTYLIPERAVGRIPDGGTNNATELVDQLERYAGGLVGEPVLRPPSGCLSLILPLLRTLTPQREKKSSAQRRFGLSAQVWSQASEEVLSVLPGRERLRLCPPTCRDAVAPSWLDGVPFAYFNLHGSAESENWYGQRDLTLPGTGPLMPIAFSPKQIPAGRVEGAVVFSEACYGADILGRDRNSSIALRFLSEGALGVVGSTVISYGVSQPPLTDADLIGLYFWRYLLQGKTLGDALLQAKIDFTQEMYRRQGYLDGDDMKTLIEFVLYGDPLATVSPAKSAAQPHTMAAEVPVPPLLCEKHAKSVALHHLSGNLVSRVRRSLSWLQQGDQVTNVEVTLSSACPGGICVGPCRGAKSHAGSGPEASPEALIFSTHRDVQTEDGIHLPQVARVVVDSRGKIVKMAATR
jgi:tetratricopeptide (TPR) repeat protein